MKYFEPNEILEPAYGNSLYWQRRLMSPTILTVGDQYREEYGKTFINTPWNGIYKDSGIRNIKSFMRMNPDKDIKDFDLWRSAHPRGRALDLKPQEHSVEKVFKDILENSKFWFKLGLRRLEAIELTTSDPNISSDGWNHLDDVETGLDDLIVITYKNAYTIEQYKEIRDKI